jgi:tRNA-splicing ligase RtcB (3'-phosphate/5'-hydroxy nucleic acid ligase)
MKTTKTSENIFQIEKEGKMLVPGVVFASDSLFEKIKQDKTLEQVKNVAMLPGIVEKSLAMPDAHQGYGFSVGGVAAFDLEKGIISPGGIGYDINCLTGDTRILTEFGSSIKIENFENVKEEVEFEQKGIKIKQILFSEELQTLNLETKQTENKRVELFMSRESENVFEIVLESGLKIRATPEHPFLTKKGMKLLSELNSKEFLAVNLFDGIENTSPIDKKSAITAKVLGYMFGDGCLYKTGKNLCGSAYGPLEDLEEMRKDLERINVNSKIYSRNRKHRIITKYGEKEFSAINNELHIHSQNFLEDLEKLGMPLGNKTRQEIIIPEWIKKGNKLIKRLFLAGFFGAEMSSPKASSKTCFFCPTIDQNKIEKLSQNARDFLIDLALLLEEFGIKNTKISEMDDYKNKYDEKTRRFRLFIKSDKDNLRLWQTIGFEYNKKREMLANIASLYILLKQKEHERRKDLSKRINEYRKKGFKLSEVKGIFLEQINERFIERHFYENASERISLDFISFNDFCENKLEELKKTGVIFDKISEIKKVEGKFRVYDFNVRDNHNFIANNFVVSNCGVRLLTTSIFEKEFMFKREPLLSELDKNIPSGVGVDGEFKLADSEMKEVLEQGSNWALKKSYATEEDLANTEDSGCIKGADFMKVSQRARARGRAQLGTIGAGNHFIELQKVTEIFDEKIAKAFGLEKDQIVLMIHTGSRGLGHQVCSDYIQKMEREFGFKHLPDRELACAPLNSELAKDYLAAMSAAANFAFANRQLITFQARKSFKKYFPKAKLSVLYDVAHNIAKFEEFSVNGKNKTLCVHRKGATRSFGPGRKELPRAYQKTGQPVLIPGSMGTSSFVLVGTEKAREVSFASTAHGAGRLLSRSFAKDSLSLQEIKKDLKEKDILIKAGSQKGLLEEAPQAYKDVDEVVRVSHELGIGNLVAKLKPLGVIKG